MPNMQQKYVFVCVREREQREGERDGDNVYKLLTHAAKIASTSIPSPPSESGVAAAWVSD